MLIDTNVAHAFDCDGQLTAIGWIEGESRLAGQLRDRVLDGRPYALLDDPLCDHLADRLGPAYGKTTGCPEAYKRWRDALGWLAIDVTPEPEYDDRIAAVLDYLRATPSPPPSIEDLTRIAHLSQSRLQHLFRDQVDVPIRRYLLWHRYLTALSLLADGASVTRAAHAADFADSAHLTRTAVRMNGFVTVLRPHRGPGACGSCPGWWQHELTARSRRVRQAAVQCRERGIEQLSDRDVPSVIARHVLPELPYPRSARLVGKELHAQVQQVGVRERCHVGRDVAGQCRPPQDIGGLDRHQVRSRQRIARQQ